MKYFYVEIEYSASDIDRLIVEANSENAIKEFYNKNGVKYRYLTIREYNILHIK